MPGDWGRLRKMLYPYSVSHYLNNANNEFEKMATEDFADAEKQFKEKYKEKYGYRGTIDEMREKEFSRVKGTFLDHVGATLYSESQIDKHADDLRNNVFGNPHSGNSSSQLSTDLMNEARSMVLRHFNTNLERHHVVFTSGATAALKVVAENFNWTKDSKFVFLEDSHTSVVGMREIARKDGATVICTTEEELKARLKEGEVVKHVETIPDDTVDISNSNLNSTSEIIDKENKLIQERLLQNYHGLIQTSQDLNSNKICLNESGLKPNGIQEEEKPGSLLLEPSNSGSEKSSQNNTIQVSSLFSFPAMSNFCGRKYPLEWVAASKNGSFFRSTNRNTKLYVLLDSASFVGTNELDLSQVEADFVPISFYKIFGFPTGIGALILRVDAVEAFRSKYYYGGGTVYSTISSINHHVLKNEISEKYEDGTNSFLSIIALKHGFYSLKKHTGAMPSITDHAFALTQFTYNEMKGMTHVNGVHLCKIYSDTSYQDQYTQGPVINFNLINSNGDYIGYSQVERLANLSNVQLRVGCFCNTGDCQKHLSLTSEKMLSNYKAGHVCGDQMDIIDGEPTGSVRISFGYMSCFRDAWMFLHFLKDCFLETAVKYEEDVKESTFYLGNESAESDILLKNSSHVVCDEARNEKALINSAATKNFKNQKISLQIQSKFSEGQTSSCRDFKTENSKHKEGNLPIEDASLDVIGKSSDYEIGGCQNLQQYERCFLKRIYVYPVKSCAAFEVPKWMFSEKGLLYDREWMIVSEYGSVLTQKKEPRMVFIKPAIDLDDGVLILRCKGHRDITVPLDVVVAENLLALDRENCLSRVCGDRVSCDDCGDEVADWLSEILGKSYRLVRQNAEQMRFLKRKDLPNKLTDLKQSSESNHRLSLSNESQYLLISETSLSELFRGFKKSKESVNLDDLAASFRGNFLITGNFAYREDNWKEVKIGGIHFKISGKCQRCQMICINQNTAMRNREPLTTLVRMRGSRMEFGIYLVSKYCEDGKSTIQVGDEVIPFPFE